MPTPPVSVRSKKRPAASTMDDTRSRVTPAVGSTMLIRRPASQLNRDDLPTFGRPTMATMGRATTKTSDKAGSRRVLTTESQRTQRKTGGREKRFEVNLLYSLC